jgi:hypothetical protein
MCVGLGGRRQAWKAKFSTCIFLDIYFGARLVSLLPKINKSVTFSKEVNDKYQRTLKQRITPIHGKPAPPSLANG